MNEARAVEINEDVAVFSRLNEYRPGALFHASKSVLDVFHSCDKVFRQLEPFLPSTFEPLETDPELHAASYSYNHITAYLP